MLLLLAYAVYGLVCFVDTFEFQFWWLAFVPVAALIAAIGVALGVRKLTAKEAWRIKMKGPSGREVRDRIPADRRWWTRTEASSDAAWPVRLVSPRSPPKSGTRRKAAVAR